MSCIELKFEDYYNFIKGEDKCLMFNFEEGIYFLWHNYLDSLNYYISLDRFYPDCEFNKELKKSRKLPKYGNNCRHKAVMAVEKLLSSLCVEIKLV